MQIETIGKYQLRLIAHEVQGAHGWDPYVEIFKFDDATQDFRCAYEKHHASLTPLASYEDAIEHARRVGAEIIKKEDL